MLRRRQAMMGGIPLAYRGLRNPFPPDGQVTGAGQTLYLANCAACHGEQGAGDGPAASGLHPAPADLRRAVRWPMASDGYLMWAIGEGGVLLGTAVRSWCSGIAIALADVRSAEARIVHRRRSAILVLLGGLVGMAFMVALLEMWTGRA